MLRREMRLLFFVWFALQIIWTPAALFFTQSVSLSERVMVDVFLAVLNLIFIAVLAWLGIDAVHRSKPWVIALAVIGVIIGSAITYRAVISQRNMERQITGVPAHLDFIPCELNFLRICNAGEDFSIIVTGSDEKSSVLSIIVDI